MVMGASRLRGNFIIDYDAIRPYCGLPRLIVWSGYTMALLVNLVSIVKAYSL